MSRMHPSTYGTGPWLTGTQRCRSFRTGLNARRHNSSNPGVTGHGKGAQRHPRKRLCVVAAVPFFFLLSLFVFRVSCVSLCFPYLRLLLSFQENEGHRGQRARRARDDTRERGGTRGLALFRFTCSSLLNFFVWSLRFASLLFPPLICLSACLLSLFLHGFLFSLFFLVCVSLREAPLRKQHMQSQSQSQSSNTCSHKGIYTPPGGRHVPYAQMHVHSQADAHACEGWAPHNQRL